MTSFMIILSALGVAGGVPLWLASPPPTRLECGVEYLFPDSPERNIETISADAFWGKAFLENRLELYLGATGTYAWGSIIQLEGTGILAPETLRTSGIGLGPAFLARANLLEVENLTLSLDGSAGFLLYGDRFPAGGDIYNFMFRTGPRLGVGLDRQTSLFVKYQWMHVSNGQGLVPQNPSYTAQGPVVGLNWAF